MVNKHDDHAPHPLTLVPCFPGNCHGNVSIRNIVSTVSNDVHERQWSLTNLSCALHVSKNSECFGGITLQGFAQFNTDTLPPEMFTKVSPAELKQYWNYWHSVENRFGVKIDKAIIEPVVDVATGESFVVKCHFLPLGNDVSNHLLPYQLIPASPCSDIWALGQLLFLLCTGRTLFQVAPRDGRLVEYGRICDWDAAPVIYEHVSDPLAQDLLLKLLSPYEERRDDVTIDVVLGHPFVTGRSHNVALMDRITEDQRLATAAHKRLLIKKMHTESEKKWLEERSVSIQCWDFALLERIHLSPSAMVHGLSTRKVSAHFPCSFLLLPFDLNKTVPSVDTVEMTERLGKVILLLSKACYFAGAVKQATSSASSSSSSHQWSLSELLRVLDLSSSGFEDIQCEMTEMAAQHVEAFRHDPICVALMMVQNRLKNVLACFEDRSVFVYFVDEYTCLPITNHCSPLRVSDEWRDRVLRSGTLFMHLCSLYTRGVSEGLDGFAKLLYQTDGVAVPPSWNTAASGMQHKLDEVAFINEINLLQEALSEMFSTQHQLGDDDLDVLRDFLSAVDPQRQWGGLQMVRAAEACIWTTSDGVGQLKELSRSVTFKDALRQRKGLENNNVCYP